MNAPPMKWLVHEVLPGTGLCALYGPPGSGKTFLMLDLCIALASGEPWFGHAVPEPVSVVYIALEGQRGFGQRLNAWTIDHGEPLPDRLRFLTQPFDLRSTQDVHDLCKTVLKLSGQGGLIVIDTLSRAAPGVDENSAIDMGELIAACARIQEKTSGVVMVVHHTGKSDGKGLRGHSSLTGAVDCTIETSRIGTNYEWALAKSRDSADGLRHGFELKPVTIDPDGSGQPRTSLIVKPLEGPAPAPAKKLPVSLRPLKPIFDELSKSTGGGPVRFDELCKVAKQKFENENQGKKFRKDNIQRAFGKYSGEEPSDDTLVSL